MTKEINLLIKALTKPLPGHAAQKLMSPSVRFTGHIKYDESRARISSVLILLYKKDNEWCIPLIQRPQYDGAHSGQVSFPGGKQEKDDKSYLDTALREAYEEVGVNPSELEFICELSSLYIPNSNFIVYPQVCITETQPVFIPDLREVESIIETPVKQLLLPETVHHFARNINGRQVDAPYYKIDDFVIWGATAMMLSEFLAMISLSEVFSNQLSRSYNACSAPECR
ncbi:CoA pyrophosphatase [Carboxylicivirga sp. M1479]|uniref:NUDIX hydrolase n=1 Tax=Carboxylicivirga sp. M1479 TaxID=2594476 RepID=UPI0011774F70|nr:CoA pyrophosphatase [Carboxylicivirga sp. M1479]TRX64242.1 CoA pyrophosphatase [Carboxylicivirga sp. M1479]